MIVSYKIRLSKTEKKALEETADYYQSLVAYLVPVCLLEYENWKDLTQTESLNYMEKQIHSTRGRKNKKKGNTPPSKARYSVFDRKFYKCQSYYRRSALTDALGIVSAYKSLLSNWEADGQTGKKPTLRIRHNTLPTMYRGLMFRMQDGRIQLKLRWQNDWKWFSFDYRKSDLRYIQKHFDFSEASAPTLERCGHGFALRFMFEKKHLDLPEEVHRVCAVDLGMNTDAVCSVIEADGTIVARAFFNAPYEKDRLYRILNEIKQKQKQGNRSPKKLWRYACNYNNAIVCHTVSEILKFASEHNCQCVVAEHLNIRNRCLGGSLRQRFHMWKTRDITRRLETGAHKRGMRFSTVCAWGTSRLAYDGSGRVKRGKEVGEKVPYGICRFATGKQYACDLSASYNIGARYLVRRALQNLSESERLAVSADIPEAAKRTMVTLSTLWKLHELGIA